MHKATTSIFTWITMPGSFGQAAIVGTICFLWVLSFIKIFCRLLKDTTSYQRDVDRITQPIYLLTWYVIGADHLRWTWYVIGPNHLEAVGSPPQFNNELPNRVEKIIRKNTVSKFCHPWCDTPVLHYLSPTSLIIALKILIYTSVHCHDSIATPEDLKVDWVRGTRMPLHINIIVEHLNIALHLIHNNCCQDVHCSCFDSFPNRWYT